MALISIYIEPYITSLSPDLISSISISGIYQQIQNAFPLAITFYNRSYSGI